MRKENLKFRFWDEDGKMFIPTKIEFHKNKSKSIYIFSEYDGASFYGELGSAVFDLMQYTGRKDKNGKEIYEGDILAFETLPDDMYEKVDLLSIVSFEDGAFRATPIRYKTWKKAKKDCGNYEFEIHEDDYVIGNIWENPELLL